MIEKIGLFVIAAGLVLAALDVDATSHGCLPGIKQLFCGSSYYAKFAEQLHKATTSSELADNVKVAFGLLSGEDIESGRDEYKTLVLAFSKLDNSSVGRLCSRSGLKSTRIVADAMKQEGNLGPQKVSPAIRRLNQLVIRLVNEARKACFQYLESHWPSPWAPKFSQQGVYQLIVQWNRLPRAFVYEGYTDHFDPSSESVLADELSRILAYNQMVSIKRARDMNNLFDLDPYEEKLEELIDEPCKDFMALEESRTILEPYVNLLMSSYIVMPAYQNMDKFYQDPSVKPETIVDVYLDKVLTNAKRFRACQRLISMGHKNIAKLLRRAAHKDIRDGDW